MKAFFIIGLFLNSIFLFSQNIKYVNTESLNVRSGAGKQYEIINNVSQGEKVATYKTIGDWTEIEFKDGKRGYVSAKYLIRDIQQKESYFPFFMFLFIFSFIVFVSYRIIVYIKYGSTSRYDHSDYDNDEDFVRNKTSNNENVSNIERQKLIQLDFENRIEKRQTEKDKLELERQNKKQAEIDRKNKIKQDDLDKRNRIDQLEKSKFICKNCGRIEKDLKHLTFGQCKESSTGKHQPFEGGIQDIYMQELWEN